MEKPFNNRAWFMVLPVFIIVAFSAILPLMTVVNYSVQDTFGNNQFFWNGIGWFKELLDPSSELGGRFIDAMFRNFLFSFLILLIEIPLGIVDQSKYYEVTKFLSLTGHIYSMIGCLISKRSFDRLPADLKTAVTEAAAEATPAQRAANAQATAGFRDSLQKHGMQINEVPDKAAFLQEYSRDVCKFLLQGE
jgi:type IV secretory pathway VirB6-like protein